MPLIHRVDYEASSQEAHDDACECLNLYVDHQLAAPNPGVLVYHFSRPDPEKRPLYMEYFEVYKDDAVFWNHTADPEHKFAMAFMKAFKQGNWKARSWYCYGDFDDEEKMKFACEGLGAQFPEGRLAGFYLNSNFTSDSAKDASSFVYLKFMCELKKGDSAQGLKNPSANVPKAIEIFEGLVTLSNNEMLTFFAHTPEPKTFPERAEVLLVASNAGLGLFLNETKATWLELKELCAKITCDVYGPVSDDCLHLLKATASEVTRCHTDIGYILHPQAKDVIKKE